MYRMPLVILLSFLFLASCSTPVTQNETSRTTANTKTPVKTKNLKELQFILANYDLLILEISRGKGKHLEFYSSLLGISQIDRELFFEEIKNNSDYLSRQEFPYLLYKELRNTLAKNKKFSHLNITL